MFPASCYAPTATSPGSATISRTWTTPSPAGSATPPTDRWSGGGDRAVDVAGPWPLSALQPLGQVGHELRDRLAHAGVERHLLADGPAGGPRAQLAHEVDDAVQLVGLEREDPLVVAEGERRDRVGPHVGVAAGHLPVLASMNRRSSSGSRYHS